MFTSYFFTTNYHRNSSLILIFFILSLIFLPTCHSLSPYNPFIPIAFTIIHPSTLSISLTPFHPFPYPYSFPFLLIRQLPTTSIFLFSLFFLPQTHPLYLLPFPLRNVRQCESLRSSAKRKTTHTHTHTHTHTTTATLYWRPLTRSNRKRPSQHHPFHSILFLPIFFLYNIFSPDLCYDTYITRVRMFPYVLFSF